MTLLLLDFIRNRKVLLIVDKCPAHPEIGGLKATELCFLPPKTTSITQPMEQGVILSLKAKYHSRIIQQIVKAIDASKSIPKVNILDAMLTVCWEDVAEETVKECFTKSRISPKEKGNAQNDVDKLFIELRSNMKKLALMKFLRRLLPKNLQISMIPLLQRNLFDLMSQSLQWCVKSRSQPR